MYDVEVPLFKILFKETHRVNLIERIKFSSFLPRFVNGEQNDILMQLLIKEELNEVILLSKKLWLAISSGLVL
jgi:hypothetical protein